VPYDDWTDLLFGVRLNELFGWRRNNFDRLVHLSYGLRFGPVLFARFPEAGLSIRRAALTAVEVVLSSSAVYELFEWAIALTLAPGGGGVQLPARRHVGRAEGHDAGRQRGRDRDDDRSSSRRPSTRRSRRSR
jgi:uncharacterized membrane protein YjdF